MKTKVQTIMLSKKGKLSLYLNKIAIIQYSLIYILIQYNGGRLLSFLGSDVFYFGSIILSLVVIFVINKKLEFKKDFFLFIIVTFLSTIVTYAITIGDLSIGSILSVLSRFLIVYVAIIVDQENFLIRFLKLVYLFAIVSLILFAFVQITGEESAEKAFSVLYEIKNEKYWLGSSYGLFFICYNFMDASRNTYMFGEPGEYQFLIITALYLLVFFEKNIIKKQKIKYYIVFIITLITIQSTTGYFNLVILLVGVLFVNRYNINKFYKKITWFLIAIIAIYLLMFYTEESFLFENLFYKIISDDGSLNFAQNTGAARIGPINRFIETCIEMPEKLIFGVGYEGLENTPLGGYQTSGIINFISMFGIITSFIVFAKMFISLKKHTGIIPFLIALFFIINMGISQPTIMSVMSVLICFYGIYSKENSKFENT